MEETALEDGVWALRFTFSWAFFYIALFIKFVFQPQKEKNFLKESHGRKIMVFVWWG